MHTSSTIREMQIKTTVQYPLTLTKTFIIKTTQPIGQDVEIWTSQKKMVIGV